MSEVEALGLVDGTAEPLWEISKIETTLTISILYFQKFLEISVVYGLRSAKECQEILNRHHAIEVFI